MNRGNWSLGFTLIELLVVVALLGILAAIGVPMFTGYIENSKNASVESSLRSIYLAQQDYKREEGAYYTPGTINAARSAELFSGKQMLDLDKYTYSIRRVGNGFTAQGQANGASCVITMTHLNQLTRNSACN